MRRGHTLLPLLALMLLAACGPPKRLNPQMPPELRPREGPRAAAVSRGETPPPGPEASTTHSPDPSPAPAAPPVADVARADESPAVFLPEAPPPGEGKSGRLLIEPLTAPPQSELPSLPDDPEFRRALRQWDQGPVRYIILKEEQDLFRQLTTDEDRLRFIQDFWSRRDRTPQTPENEYRQEFWRRVADADRRFIDTPQPGWKTDRGRIWILLGPPDETDDFRSRTKGPGVLRWIYRNRPNLFLEPNFIVAFRQTYAGGWELSNNPKDFDPVFRDLESSTRPFISTVGLGTFLPSDFGAKIDIPVVDYLSLFLDLGQATAPPELYRDREREAQVEATEIFGAMDIRTSFEFLGPAPDGQVRTGIVLGVLKGSLVSETDAEEADAQLSLDMSIYAGELEDPDRVIRIPGGFGPSRENYVASLSRRLLYRTEISLEPGRYLAVYRILDRTTGQAAQARESFTVPDRFADGDLQLSTIVLASRLAPVNTAVERPDAFTLGLFRVVPNLDATYRNGETLAFYYQVSGAALDPRTGRRRLDAEYSFAVRQGESWLELGEGLIYRDQTQPQAWSAPLQDWPPASYRLTVKITDVVRGATTSNVTFFRVVPGS